MKTSISLMVVLAILLALLARQEHFFENTTQKSTSQLIASTNVTTSTTEAERLQMPIINTPYDNGKALFLKNCVSCHLPMGSKVKDGYKTDGIIHRWSGREEKLKAFIRNSQKVIKSGDAYANTLYNEYNKAQMPAFPHLTDKEIDDILQYMGTTACNFK